MPRRFTALDRCSLHQFLLPRRRRSRGGTCHSGEHPGEFRNGNTFGAVAFSSFGAFWISFWALEAFYAKDITGNAGHAVGLYLWAWAIFTAYMTIAAMRTSGAVLLVFALLTATFVLLAIGESGAHETVTHWGGYLGLATAAAAWYASFAAVVNSTFGRTIAPVIPLSPGSRGEVRNSQ